MTDIRTLSDFTKRIAGTMFSRSDDDDTAKDRCVLRFIVTFNARLKMRAEAGDVHTGFFVNGNVDKVIGTETRDSCILLASLL